MTTYVKKSFVNCLNHINAPANESCVLTRIFFKFFCFHHDAYRKEVLLFPLCMRKFRVQEVEELSRTRAHKRQSRIGTQTEDFLDCLLRKLLQEATFEAKP